MQANDASMLLGAIDDEGNSAVLMLLREEIERLREESRDRFTDEATFLELAAVEQKKADEYSASASQAHEEAEDLVDKADALERSAEVIQDMLASSSQKSQVGGTGG